MRPTKTSCPFVESLANRNKKKSIAAWDRQCLYLLSGRDLFFLYILGRDVRQIFGSSSRHRIGRTATRDRLIIIATIDTPDRQTLTVNSLDKDPGDLLRKRTVFGRRP